MKVLCNALKVIGVSMVMIGGAGMDSPSVFVPFILALAGVGIMVAGVGVENEFNL